MAVCALDDRAAAAVHYRKYVPVLNAIPVSSQSSGIRDLPEAEGPGYYLVIDYITEEIARFLAFGFKNPSTHLHVITITALAKVSAKMKVLSHRIEAFAKQSFDSSTDLDSEYRRQERRKRTRLDDSGQPLVINNKLYGYEEEESVVIKSYRRHHHCLSSHPDASDLELEYEDTQPDEGPILRDFELFADISDMCHATACIYRILWHILEDLSARNIPGRSPTSSTCAPSSTAPAPTSTPRSCTRAAFTNSRALLRASLSDWASTRLTNYSAIPVTLSINTDGLHQTAETVQVISIPDLVAAIVALSFLNPSVLSAVIQAYIATRRPAILQRIAPRFGSRAMYGTFASLQSTPTARQVRRQHEVSLEHTFSLVPSKSLSRSFLTNLNFLLDEAHRKTHMKVLRQSSTWATDETSITVPFGTRIEGVDPFNLTMFAWIIAGFSVVVAKGLRVRDWPWRDFIAGRVTCCSVGELANVTSIDPQGIITHLLALEDEMPLVTRGPYNSVLSHRGDGGDEGFSMDVQITIGTLARSGMLVVEVVTTDRGNGFGSGSALVCLDLRPDIERGADHGDWASTRHSREHTTHISHQQEDVQILACMNPPGECEPGSEIVLRWRETGWEKIVGVHDDVRNKLFAISRKNHLLRYEARAYAYTSQSPRKFLANCIISPTGRAASKQNDQGYWHKNLDMTRRCASWSRGRSTLRYRLGIDLLETLPPARRPPGHLTQGTSGGRPSILLLTYSGMVTLIPRLLAIPDADS
ncbi:hypothetical protein B0H63DRAFT_529572 [Podospora didyma]|uniref:Uncharacterized protein n=1 Tax=Podospora didyma TaxID=330526 RepID=A0AAE0K1A7_9PEZI|nr:hypothetical protein B0H63DRAFT_529572 [Podospora didyma]